MKPFYAVMVQASTGAVGAERHVRGREDYPHPYRWAPFMLVALQAEASQLLFQIFSPLYQTGAESLPDTWIGRMNNIAEKRHYSHRDWVDLVQDVAPSTSSKRCGNTSLRAAIVRRSLRNWRAVRDRQAEPVSSRLPRPCDGPGRSTPGQDSASRRYR